MATRKTKVARKKTSKVPDKDVLIMLQIIANHANTKGYRDVATGVLKLLDVNTIANGETPKSRRQGLEELGAMLSSMAGQGILLALLHKVKNSLNVVELPKDVKDDIDRMLSNSKITPPKDTPEE